MKTGATRGIYAEQYFPNTETLMPDEMRIVALGTGRPSTVKAKLSSCLPLGFFNEVLDLF